MKRLVLSIMCSLFLSTASAAQHVEIGAFMNYDHQDVAPGADNLFGLGGRLDINVTKYFQWELETAYDFKYSQFSTTRLVSSVAVTKSELGVLHANTGIKLQTAGGSFFGFVKGGLNRYDLDTTDQFVPSLVVTSTNRSFVKGVLYPGAGVGFHAGPLGIRLDAGDEIVWLDGEAKHSLRITFGPTFRF